MPIFNFKSFHVNAFYSSMSHGSASGIEDVDGIVTAVSGFYPTAWSGELFRLWQFNWYKSIG